MFRHVIAATVAFTIGCESKPKTPSAPPVPDIPLPEKPDVAEAKSAEKSGDMGADGGGSGEMKDPKSPIAPNLLPFVPEVLDGVRARRRQAVQTAPKAYAFFKGPKHKTYNVQLTGPETTEQKRRAANPLLGKEGEVEDNGIVETKGLKVKGFDAQRTYDRKKEKSEVIVLVNPFVEVKLSVQPAKKPDEATKLVETLDLEGISKLR